MENIYLAKQPILDRNKDLVAYELFFRANDQDESAGFENGLSATANVIVNAYGNLGIQNVLGQQRGFININKELIKSDLVSLLPNKHVVLEISSSEEIDEEFITLCTELKKSGYQFALAGVTAINENMRRILPLVNIVKIDVSGLSKEALTNLVNQMKPWPVLLFLADGFCRRKGQPGRRRSR